VTAGRLTAGRALFLSGTGRYADPWHLFAETSAAYFSSGPRSGPSTNRTSRVTLP
jgi:hypothetical protein